MMAAVGKSSLSRRLFQIYFSELCSHNRNALRNTGIGQRCLSGAVNLKKKPFRQSNLSLIAVGLGAGAALGAGYSWVKYSEPIQHKTTKEKSYSVLSSRPDAPAARRIISPTDSSNLELVLFQYPTCPFCCKVRAFLDYFAFSYDVVEVHPLSRKQISWSEYKKVPILLAKVEDGYQQLNDSSMIMSALASFLNDKNVKMDEVVKNYPIMEYESEGKNKLEVLNRYFLMYHGDIPKGKTSQTILEERKWRQWVDDVLVHTLSPNVYRTWGEATQAFTWFAQVGEWDRLFASWQNYFIVHVGAAAMLVVGKRLKKRHNLKDDVRQSLYDECNIWMRAVNSKGTTFLGGDSPNLADLSAYGVLSSIEGCDAFTDLLNNTNIGKWYEPMKQVVNSRRGNVKAVP